MLIQKERDQMISLDYGNLSLPAVAGNLLLRDPEQIIYVTDRSKLIGVLTLGDFKRSYPCITQGINRQARKVVFHDGCKEQISDIFSTESKIKRLPVVNKEDELLFEIVRAEEKADAAPTDREIFTDFLSWLPSYLEKLQGSKIAVIDHNGSGNFLAELINSSLCCDLIASDELTLEQLDSYDLIFETDRNKFIRRKEMLRIINNSYEVRYLSLEEAVFFRDSCISYNRLKNQGIHFCFYEAPEASKLLYLTDKQKRHIGSGRKWCHYFDNPENYAEELREMFGTSRYPDIIREIYNRPLPASDGENIFYGEYHSSFYNTVGGFRLTAHKNWGQYTNALNLYGACTVFGLFVKDSETIGSYLQEELNQSELSFLEVNNFGINGIQIKDMLNCMYQKEHKTGDIIVFLVSEEEIPFFRMLDPEADISELTDVFNQHPEVGPFFIDMPSHCNQKANRLIAHTMFKKLSADFQNGRFASSCADVPVRCSDPMLKSDVSKKGSAFTHNEDLELFLKQLSCYKSTDGKTAGAIVMNCNPFTNGHRYLIQYASSLVNTLFVFVVEEDKSFFRFEDRIRLVREGTGDLENVIVLPSGKFMISALTFPGYFKKDDAQDVLIDASLDISIFAQRIAPELGISIRFVGEEPIDKVTKQYNEYMKRTLPEYGIRLEEIKRICYEDGSGRNVISASKVRQYLAEEKWEEIRTIVPEPTFRYLIQNREDLMTRCPNPGP